MLKEEFIGMLTELLGKDEAMELVKALRSSPVTSVRLNKRKPGAQFPEATKVPWCKSGFYLSTRPQFILDPLLHAGAYYVQEASSMIYETVIEKLLNRFQSEQINTNKNKLIPQGDSPTFLRVLDLCAAPGGKTTAMINALPNGCEIVANEYSPKRVGALKENLDKWGYPFVTVNNKNTAFYGGEGENFDIVAVDAPCSGEGMMRKEEIARSQWSFSLVNQCAMLQKEILENAVKALKPGGFLIYSTCTFNRKENEENAEYLVKEHSLEPINLEFPEDWNIRKGINTDLPVYRFMPHLTQGEGLFLAVFRKPGEWCPSRKKAPALLSTKEECYPEVEVDETTALAYLRRQSIVLSPDSPRGMVTITYKGLPLGPAKNIGSRANNLYPKNRRILK